MVPGLQQPAIVLSTPESFEKDEGSNRQAKTARYASTLSTAYLTDIHHADLVIRS